MASHFLWFYEMACSKATLKVGAVEARHSLKLSSMRIYKQDRQPITETRSRNTCCRGRATIITYSECVFLALVIQHTMRMRRVKLSCVTSPILSYFSALSQKRDDFRKKYYGIKNVCFIFSKTLV